MDSTDSSREARVSLSFMALRRDAPLITNLPKGLNRRCSNVLISVIQSLDDERIRFFQSKIPIFGAKLVDFSLIT